MLSLRGLGPLDLIITAVPSLSMLSRLSSSASSFRPHNTLLPLLTGARKHGCVWIISLCQSRSYLKMLVYHFSCDIVVLITNKWEVRLLLFECQVSIHCRSKVWGHNDKCFLSSKSALEWLTWHWRLNIQLCLTGINCSLKYITLENSYFKL